ncbi:uncharacterized protein LOC110984380 isoform X2 [Acanthaster planci]|uniref:Uncharacterized protein LOC110984380 isoform X2 n=1 Tax=Acanthaster planci TaxID=133434 RepID=A0A8B7Z3K9_ACAPL|nr:uncharacterized protein LOC110984380 isoform X2 [Acanthaster planci]
MWHSPSKSATSTRDHRHTTTSASAQKGKTTAKSKVEVWEPLRGWEDDVNAGQDIETIDIDSWSKKNKRKKDAAKVATEGMEVYLCWASNHCSEITDYEEFVNASLTADLKPAENAPSEELSPAVKQPKSKSKPTVPNKIKSTPKNKGVWKEGTRGSTEPKSSGDDSRTYDAESEASGSSMVGRPISTAYTASENSVCGSNEGPVIDGDGNGNMEAVGGSARQVGVTRSAPVSRVQDKSEQKSRKIASAKSTDDTAKRSTQMRRVAIRNSAAKSSLDMKRLTLDMPPSPPNARLSNPSSPRRDEPNNNPGQARSEVDKAAVLRLLEERLKRSNASNRLNFDLPNSGSMSVGDLLSSSPRIVHRVGPAGDNERDPNVYAALTGDITLTDQKDTISPWSQADSAIGSSENPHRPAGMIPNGARTKEASKSILPSVSTGTSVISAAPPLDSTSTGDSVMMRQESPAVSGDGLSTVSAAAADDARLLKHQQRILDLVKRTATLWDHDAGVIPWKKPLRCAITRCDRDVAELPRANIPQPPSVRSRQIERIASVVLGRKLADNSKPALHRGPPGFRPAGKTPLQRAVESAHKKMHGQHYYLFTHTSSSQQSADLKNLPRYTSTGQPVSGHRERASSGRSNQSERSINNAYVWKEHLESQIKQQRTTPALSGSNTGGNSHQQTNPCTNQSSPATSVPLTLMPSQTFNRRKLSYTFSWENGQPRLQTSSQWSTGMATP